MKIKNLSNSIPFDPDRFYKEWNNWGDFLGDINIVGNKTVEQWVIVAEHLAKENGGILPSRSWLVKNGHGGLDSAMDKTPASFIHIQQDYKGGKSLDEWAKIAEELAKSNNGFIPNTNWLIKNGYNGLYQAMRNNPKYFLHFKQEKTLKTVDEWIAIAEKLAKENNGIIPYISSRIFKKGEYAGLYSVMKKYPEKFNHIGQLKKPKTFENVPVAEKLAKEHNGVLPNVRWLRANGYNGVARLVSKFPDSIAHIKQKRQYKSLEDHISDANQLSKNNKNLLPNVKWLERNGYTALSQAMRKTPESFKHLKQIKLQ